MIKINFISMYDVQIIAINRSSLSKSVIANHFNLRSTNSMELDLIIVFGMLNTILNSIFVYFEQQQK